MKKLELLLEEKLDLEKSLNGLSASMASLNPTRDYEYYERIKSIKQTIEEHVDRLSNEIKEVKENNDGVVVTNTLKGVILSATTESGRTVYLRPTFIKERFKNLNWNDCFVFDWVGEENINQCFIQYEKYNVDGNEFNKDIFTSVYKHHKKEKDLESKIKNKTLTLRETEEISKKHYHFIEK